MYLSVNTLLGHDNESFIETLLTLFPGTKLVQACCCLPSNIGGKSKR